MCHIWNLQVKSDTGSNHLSLSWKTPVPRSLQMQHRHFPGKQLVIATWPELWLLFREFWSIQKLDQHFFFLNRGFQRISDWIFFWKFLYPKIKPAICLIYGGIAETSLYQIFIYKNKSHCITPLIIDTPLYHRLNHPQIKLKPTFLNTSVLFLRPQLKQL